MSFSAIPAIAKQRLFRHLVQNTLTEEQTSQDRAISSSTSSLSHELFAFSQVNKECRHLAAAHLFETLDASVLLDFPLDSHLSGSPLSSYIHTIRLPLSDLEVLDIFPLLRSLPSLSTVVFDQPHLDDQDPFESQDTLLSLFLNPELRLLSEDADEAYGVLRELAEKEGMKWVFVGAKGETVAKFLHTLGRGTQHLTFETNGINTEEDDCLLEQNEPLLLRRALAECYALQSLSMVSAIPCTSDKLGHDIDPSWLTLKPAFASTLTSLTLSLPSLSTSTLKFLSLFPALTHLTLFLRSSAMVEAAPDPADVKPLPLGRLSSLSLSLPCLSSATCTLSEFHLPLLHHLELSFLRLLDATEVEVETHALAEELESHFDFLTTHLRTKLPHLRLVQLSRRSKVLRQEGKSEPVAKEERELVADAVKEMQQRLRSHSGGKGMWVEVVDA